MSDAAKKDEKKPADAKDAHGGETAAKGGLLTKLPVLLGGAMTIEAVILFAGFKMFFKAPTPAPAATLTTTADEEGDEHESKESAEKPAAEHGDKPAAAEHGEKSGGHDAKPAAEHGEKPAEHGEKPAAGHGEKSGNADAPPAPKVDKKKPVEISVLSFRAPNKQSGRTFLYDLDIYAVTRGANKEKVESTLKSRDALVKDRVRTIVAQLDPEKLGGGSEPGLETLRRQVKYQLDEIVGDGMIDEVLVPRCIPFRTDY